MHFLVLYSSTSHVRANKNDKRFLVDDGTNVAENMIDMQREIQNLKSTVQELVQAVGKTGTGTCSCQGNSYCFPYIYSLT